MSELSNEVIPKKPHGRIHDKLVVDKIIEATKRGAGVHLASKYAGVSRIIVWQWRKWGKLEMLRRDRGEEPNPDAQPYLDFYKRYIEASSKLGDKALGVVDKALDAGDAKTALRVLERKYADDGWAEPAKRVEHTGRGGKPITISVEPLPADTIMNILPRAVGDYVDATFETLELED